MKTSGRRVEILLAVILLCCNAYFWQPQLDGLRSYDGLILTFLNVGQGDAIMLRSPDGHLGLIDTGPDTSIMSQLGTVLPYYVRRFDFVLTTHPDADHIEGYLQILQKYDVGTFFWQKSNKKSTLYHEVRKLVKALNIEDYQLTEDTDFRLGCCTEFDVIWPLRGTSVYNEADPNQVSTAIVLTYAGVNIFLGGDLDSDKELEAWEANPAKRQIHILKAGHHGSSSSTSREFLERLKPQHVIFSAGADNRYGHPAPDVLSRVVESGAQIWRTDLQGRITVQISPEGEIKIYSEH